MHDIAELPIGQAVGTHTRQPAAAIGTGGFSRTRLARMQATMRRHVESGLLPGFVALVHHRGRLHVETFGAMAFDGNTAMPRDAIVRLASMTKPITAVGAMILVEECRLRLDDPVDEWLSELRDRK